MKKQKSNGIDPEISAISAVYDALRELDEAAQIRVIEYVRKKLGHKNGAREVPAEEEGNDHETAPVGRSSEAADEVPAPQDENDPWNSVSPVAKKWVQRNDLDKKFLGTIFSIGGEEIDLIAKVLPGKSMRQRVHEVILLKGIAAYLGGGVARLSHDALKEACSHYDAYDSTNLSKTIKSFAPDVSGTKENGYSLTPRGLASGAELLKQMNKPKN